ISLIPVPGLPLVQPGDDLAKLLVDGIDKQGGVRQGDVIVVAQKIVSKAEGRIVQLDDVMPSSDALELGGRADKDPRLVQLILAESREVLRVRPGLIVVEDARGF